MIITVKVRDLQEGDKFTTENASDVPYGAVVRFVKIENGWAVPYDHNGFDMMDGVSPDRIVEVERNARRLGVVEARVRELLQPLYAQVLSESGIDHGDISPGESFILEAAEERLAEAVGGWIRNTLAVSDEE